MRHNQNRRPRGRNRKGPNPLTRSYESNGPDVKVRGTPAHIAEKYTTLARDALSSGDPVSAENYHQHAEHYNRIVMAAQAQQAAQNQNENARDSENKDSDDGNQQRNDRGNDGRNGYRGNGRRDDRGNNTQDSPQASGERNGQANGAPSDASTEQQPQVVSNGGQEGAVNSAEAPRNDQEPPRQPRRSRRPRQNVDNEDSAVETTAAPSSENGVAGAVNAEEKPNGRRRRSTPKPVQQDDGAVSASAPDTSDKAGDDNAGTQDGEAALTAFPD